MMIKSKIKFCIFETYILFNLNNSMFFKVHQRDRCKISTPSN